MSDPSMAAAMEADMRRRFWISLVLFNRRSTTAGPFPPVPGDSLTQP